MAIQKTSFGGDRGDLFQLALKTGFLTLITMGIYRFWAKTRLRRWYWSSVRPGGVPLEYTGTALEKLAGFLFAIIVLAVLVTFLYFTSIMATIGLLEQMPPAVAAGLGAMGAAFIPLWFIAKYRARRYILSRTRWRGIRFGMSAGAWGYAWRACMYWALNLVSLGLLWPLKTFQLEKYLTDRTWFGNARFTQHGNFLRLYGPLLPFLVSLWGGTALLAYFGYANRDNGGLMIGRINEGWALAGGMVLLLSTWLFGIYYRIASIRVMAAYKTLGDGIEFDIYPRTRKIIRIYFFGYWKTYLAAGFVSNVVFGAVMGVMWATGNFSPEMLENPPIQLAVVIAVLTYLLIALMITVFRQTFITYPLVQHVAESFELHNPTLMGTIRQRSHDSRTDAGGFAEALDAGAAF